MHALTDVGLNVHNCVEFFGTDRHASATDARCAFFRSSIAPCIGRCPLNICKEMCPPSTTDLQQAVRVLKCMLRWHVLKGSQVHVLEHDPRVVKAFLEVSVLVARRVEPQIVPPCLSDRRPRKQHHALQPELKLVARLGPVPAIGRVWYQRILRKEIRCYAYLGMVVMSDTHGNHTQKHQPLAPPSG